MQIKKKDVILEAMLIDVTPDFTPQEKRLLKVLNKKFGEGGMYGDFDRWDGAAFLIEDFNLPYDIAHNLSLSYWWHGDKLFKEMESLHRKERRNYVFMQVFNEIQGDYIRDKKELGGTIDLTWKDEKNIINKTGDTFTIKQEVNLWDGFRGFTLYIPFYDVNISRYDLGDLDLFTNNLSLLVYIKFIDEEDSKEDTENKNPNTTIKIEVNWILKDVFSEKKPMMNFEVPIPSPLTKDSVKNIFNLILKDVYEKLESMVFPTE
jgi:hypothetical protein